MQENLRKIKPKKTCLTLLLFKTVMTNIDTSVIYNGDNATTGSADDDNNNFELYNQFEKNHVG